MMFRNATGVMPLLRRMVVVITWCVPHAKRSSAGLVSVHGNRMAPVGITVTGSTMLMLSLPEMLKQLVNYNNNNTVHQYRGVLKAKKMEGRALSEVTLVMAIR